MPSKFAGTKPVIRDHDIEDPTGETTARPARLTIDGQGVFIMRKGDKRRDKAYMFISWWDLMNAAAALAEGNGYNEDGTLVQTPDDLLGFKPEAV